jgi:hypothetical protein
VVQRDFAPALADARTPTPNPNEMASRGD